MNIFSSPRNRKLKRNRKQFERLVKSLEARKAAFRENALSRMRLLYPDMQFAIGLTSANFAGYSPQENLFVVGEFFDRYLPDQFRLEDLLNDDDFEMHAEKFARDIRDFVYESDLEDAGDRRLDEKDTKEFLRKEGAQGYTYSEIWSPYDIRIRKNGRVIGRSSSQSPKPIGYFSEKVYETIVADLNGPGVSNFSIELLLWGNCALSEREIDFIYIDPPRKSVSQSHDHYLKTCAQFMPFLQAAERFLHDPDWQEETEGMGFIASDQALGLRQG